MPVEAQRSPFADEELALQALVNAGYGSYGEEKPPFREYLRTVRKHVWLIMGITLTVTVLAAVYMARKPDVFEAQARVQVDLENIAAGKSADKGVVVVNSAANDPAYFNTQLQILKGETLQRRVVKTLDLEHNPDFLRGSMPNLSTWESVLKMVGVKKAEENSSQAENFIPSSAPPSENGATRTSQLNLAEAEKLAPLVSGIRNSLQIEPVRENDLPNRETRLIEISFAHSDPRVAAKVVNTVADTFVLSNMERRVETNTSTGEFLTKRVAELQTQIRSGEERLLNYARNNQILSLDASQNTVVDRLVGLNKQLLEAENERKLAEAALRAASAPGAAEALSEADAKLVTEAETKLTDLRQRRAHLLVDYTEKYPEVRQIDQQIPILERQIREARERAVTTVRTNLETRYRQAAARENSIREAFNRQRGETVEQNAAAINYRIIQQEIETNKNLLNSLLQQAKENDVVKAGSTNNISIAEYATTPRSPVGPKRLFVISVAFLLALCFGIALSIFVEYLNDAVESPEDVEKFLHLPTLALIPDVNGSKRRFLPKKNGNGNGNGNGHSLMKVSSSPELLFNQQSRSPLSEAYKQMRTSVLLSTAEHPPKTILITSSLPSEGKTTTSINTALSLAQTGASVLIIDGDMRRPRIHKNFGLSNKKGLSSILASNLDEKEILSLIYEDKESNIYILPSGQVPPNPAELVGSEQMRRALRLFYAAFDHIVIDSPPIVTCTDGVLISSMVDGVILVIKGGETSRDLARRSQQLLREVNAKMLGVVLNKMDKTASKYYYTNYYKHYYYESESEETLDV